MSDIREIEPLLFELYDTEQKAQDIRRQIQRVLIESGEHASDFIKDLRAHGIHNGADLLASILAMPMGEPAAVIH